MTEQLNWTEEKQKKNKKEEERALADREKETIQKSEALITIPTFSMQFLGLFFNNNLIVIYSVTHHLQWGHPFLSEYESYPLADSRHSQWQPVPIPNTMGQKDCHNSVLASSVFLEWNSYHKVPSRFVNNPSYFSFECLINSPWDVDHDSPWHL